MDTEIENRIDEYIQVYTRIEKVVDNAGITAAIIEQVGKDRRLGWMMANGHFKSKGNGDKPASEKQLGLLKKLGVEVEDNINRRDASKLIDEALAEKNAN